MIDKLAPSGYMRYSPDGASQVKHSSCHSTYSHDGNTGHFVFATFASAFLLKVRLFVFATLQLKLPLLNRRIVLFHIVSLLERTASQAGVLQADHKAAA